MGGCCVSATLRDWGRIGLMALEDGQLGGERIVPEDWFAQAVVNRLVAAGIQGVLNFSPIMLEVPSEVTVNNVDLALELEHLSYFIR